MSEKSAWRGDRSAPAEAMIKSKAISYGFKSVEDYLPGVQKLAKEPTAEQARLAEAYAAKDHGHFLFGDNKFDQAVMRRYYQGALQAQAYLEQNHDRMLGDLEKMAQASGVDWNARAYPDARFKDKNGQPLYQLVTGFELPKSVENAFVDNMVFNRPLNAAPARQISSSYLELLTPKFPGFGMAHGEAPELMNGNRMLPFMERAAAAADPGAELEKAIKEDFAQKLAWAKEHESDFNAVAKTRGLAQEKENGYAQARMASGREEFRSSSESNAHFLAPAAAVPNFAAKLAERRAGAAAAEPDLATRPSNAL